PTHTYPLSLHDALPIYRRHGKARRPRHRHIRRGRWLDDPIRDPPSWTESLVEPRLTLGSPLVASRYGSSSFDASRPTDDARLPRKTVWIDLRRIGSARGEGVQVTRSAERRTITMLAATIQTITPRNTTNPIAPSSPRTDSFSTTSKPVTQRAAPTRSPNHASHAGNARERRAEIEAATNRAPMGKTFNASTVQARE